MVGVAMIPMMVTRLQDVEPNLGEFDGAVAFEIYVLGHEDAESEVEDG